MKLAALLIILISAVPAGAQQITLGQAARETLSYSRNIKSAAAAAEAAGETVKQAEAMRLPKLSYSSQLTTGDDPVYVFGSLLRQNKFTAADFDLGRLNEPDDRVNFSNAVSAEIPLFTGFRIANYKKLGENRTEQSRRVLDFTGQAELFGTVQNYLMLGFKSELKKIAEETEKSTAEELKVADRLRSKGFILGSDYYAAQSALSGIKSSRAALDKEILAESASLAVRLGRDPETMLTPAPGFSAFLYETEDEKTQIAGLKEARGDIAAARLEAKNAGISREIEADSVLPQIGAFAELQTNTRDFSSNPLSRTAGINMTIEFGDFTRDSRIKQREAQKKQAEQKAAAMTDSAVSELLKLRRQYESAKAALPAAKEAVENAKRSLEIFKPMFRNGRQSVLEVVRAETALMAARSSLAEITFKLHSYYASALFMAGELDTAAADRIGAAVAGGAK